MKLQASGGKFTKARIRIVVALIEGDEQRTTTTKFYNSAMKERPPFATVDNVRSQDYIGDVMPLWQFASINTAS